MKRTLIALFALGSAAMGVTLEDATYTSTGSTIALSTELQNISAVVTLDVESLQAAMAKGAALSKHTLIDFQDTDGSDIGLQTNYVSANNVIGTSGLYGCWNQGGAYSFGMDTGTGFESTSFWTNAVGASAALTYSYGANGTTAGTNAVFTLSFADGTTKTYGGTINTGLKGSAVKVDSVVFDDNLVKKAWVFNSTLDIADAKALTVAAIPEPTTATLSLLALAGLAARRRRK